MSAMLPESAVPDFAAAATGNPLVPLADLERNNAVLYGYPKDNTPGCAQRPGISRDSLKSRERFKKKFNPAFDLIADGDEILCNLFGVIETRTSTASGYAASSAARFY